MASGDWKVHEFMRSVEIPDELIAFETRPRETELAMCQKYYEGNYQKKPEYGGVLNISEEMLLEALGITGGDVRLRSIMINPTRNSISLVLMSSDPWIPTHDNKGYQLEQVRENCEFPHIKEQEEPQ